MICRSLVHAPVMQRTPAPQARRALPAPTRYALRPELGAAAARHGGVFTRPQAVRAGYTEREMKTATGPGGGWVIVRRGCYAERALWEATDDDGRYRMQVHAALLTAREPAVASHGSSAALLGLPMRPYWRGLVHVTRPGVHGARTEGGIKHHRAAFTDDDLAAVDGLTVMGLARTAVDIAREHGFGDGVVAADAALRLGARREHLERALDPMTCWPYVTGARAAVRYADGGAQSVGESLLRLIVLELDRGVPETQFIVREGDRWAAVDLRLGRHLFEFDGRVKYLGREQGGVDDRPPEVILWEEKQREDWLRRVDGGYGISRVIWPEMFGAARARTLRRLDAEVAETLRRFGPG